MTSIYGMGADNVLSFEAITAKGEYVTANAEKNSDLFWVSKLQPRIPLLRHLLIVPLRCRH